MMSRRARPAIVARRHAAVGVALLAVGLAPALARATVPPEMVPLREAMDQARRHAAEGDRGAAFRDVVVAQLRGLDPLRRARVHAPRGWETLHLRLLGLREHLLAGGPRPVDVDEALDTALEEIALLERTTAASPGAPEAAARCAVRVLRDTWPAVVAWLALVTGGLVRPGRIGAWHERAWVLARAALPAGVLAVAAQVVQPQVLLAGQGGRLLTGLLGTLAAVTALWVALPRMAAVSPERWPLRASRGSDGPGLVALAVLLLAGPAIHVADTATVLTREGTSGAVGAVAGLSAMAGLAAGAGAVIQRLTAYLGKKGIIRGAALALSLAAAAILGAAVYDLQVAHLLPATVLPGTGLPVLGLHPTVLVRSMVVATLGAALGALAIRRLRRGRV